MTFLTQLQSAIPTLPDSQFVRRVVLDLGWTAIGLVIPMDYPSDPALVGKAMENWTPRSDKSRMECWSTENKTLVVEDD